MAHGVTTLAQTDVFGHLSSISTTDGGLQVTGLADATGIALGLKGVQSSDPTDTTPAVKIIGAKASGTGVQDLAAAETVFQVANNDNAAALTILGDGKVGIYSTTPKTMLDVSDSDYTPAYPTISAMTKAIFATDGSASGNDAAITILAPDVRMLNFGTYNDEDVANITVNASNYMVATASRFGVSSLAAATVTHACFNGSYPYYFALCNAADIAEWMPVVEGIEEGDVITTSNIPNPYSGEEPHQLAPYSYQKSTTPYQSNLIGIIAQEDIAEALNQRVSDTYRLVSLAGRTFVKVSTENGPIAVGDYLTSSSMPGVAMKATKSGPTIAIALEAYDGVGVGKIPVFVNRGFYDPEAGNYLAKSGGEVMGSMNVTAAGTPLVVNLGGETNVNAVRNIFETKVNGEMIFQIMETGDATLSGKLTLGSIQTIADVEIGGGLKLASNLQVGGMIRMDNQGNLKNIPSLKVTASVNPDGTITQGNIPATSVGASVSIAQTSTDPISATRAALALSTQGSTPSDYLIYSEPFQVTYDGKVIASKLAVKEGIELGSDTLQRGNIISVKLADAFDGFLMKFETTSGRTVFAINAQGLLETDALKARALVIDNTDEPRATIGSGVIPAGAISAQVLAPEVKPGMKIFLTPKLPITQSLAVTDIQEGNFTVSLASSIAQDLPFDWWLVDVTNPSFTAAVSGSVYGGNSVPVAPISGDSGSTISSASTEITTTIPSDTTIFTPDTTTKTTTTPTETATPTDTTTQTSETNSSVAADSTTQATESTPGPQVSESTPSTTDTATVPEPATPVVLETSPNL